MADWQRGAGKGEGARGERKTYRQTMLNAMTIACNLKMLARPRAKQRIMDRMPSLDGGFGS